MKPLIVPFFISNQGCPHRCVFCNQVKIAGGGGLPSADELLERIAVHRVMGGGRPVEVAFYGGTFTSLPESEMARLLLPLQPLLAGGEVDSIRLSTRPDAVDAGIIGFLVRMGVRTVELGVQSMADDVLTQAGRGHTAARTVEACRALKAAGMTVGLQLMPGLPGDNGEKALASLRACLTLRPDFLRIYPALVIAGTRLAELYAAGSYTPLGLEETVGLCRIMLHAALAAGVRVVRIGLQATAELEAAGTVLAGPYHPAFRQLVESALIYDLLRKLVGEMFVTTAIEVFCTPARVSEVIGQRKENLARLAREGGVTVSAVTADPALSPLELMVKSGQNEMKGNIVSDLNYTQEECSLA